MIERIAFALSVLLFFGISNVHAASTVEVVQSFPIETQLQVPGIAQTQQVWLDIVNSANQTLDIEQYYINNKTGESLDPILSAIKSAAGRGVHVRIILDSAFLAKNSNEADTLKNIQNIEIRKISFSPGIMHAKYMVADGINAYTGSANMDWLALSHIHEMGIHTQDATVGASLESIFSKDWPNATALPTSSPALFLSDIRATFAGFLSQLSGGLSGIEVVASPKQANPNGISDTLEAVTSLMNNANSSLKIQVYEYSTTPFGGHGAQWTPLDTVIRAAATRGVQVRLMVDATVLSPKSKAELQALAALKNIQIKAVTIPKWSGGALQYARLIHSKYFVIDQTSGWVGSENWLDSYFISTRNVGIAIQNATIAQQLDQVYESVWNSPYAATVQ